MTYYTVNALAHLDADQVRLITPDGELTLPLAEASLQSVAQALGDLTDLAPHQQRVVAEHADLKKRFLALKAAISRVGFLAIPYKERQLLETQARIMERYVHVLEQRIAGFRHLPEAA